MSILPRLPDPRDIVYEAIELGKAGLDRVQAAADRVVELGREGVELAKDGAEYLYERGKDGVEFAADQLKEAADCVAGNFDWTTGTILAVVDGAALACTGCPGAKGVLRVPGISLPTLEHHAVATVQDHLPVVNIVPFPGSCNFTNHQPCDPSPLGPWVPGANSALLATTNPLLPSVALLGCAKGGIISISDPGQSTLSVSIVDPPVGPPGVDLDENIKQAHLMSLVLLTPDRRLAWIYQQVRNGGPWDYKQRGRQYAEFGNYNYGATGDALGIPRNVLLRAAGFAQQRAGTSEPEWGSPTDLCGDSSYGDDPHDQEMIEAGIHYHRGQP